MKKNPCDYNLYCDTHDCLMFNMLYITKLGTANGGFMASYRNRYASQLSLADRILSNFQNIQIKKNVNFCK
jgi:hypothetical protein